MKTVQSAQLKAVQRICLTHGNHWNKDALMQNEIFSDKEKESLQILGNDNILLIELDEFVEVDESFWETELFECIVRTKS